jgi:hypothetical protein
MEMPKRLIVTQYEVPYEVGRWLRQAEPYPNMEIWDQMDTIRCLVRVIRRIEE